MHDRAVRNTKFNFTLKTDDDCFVDVEAIVRVRTVIITFIIGAVFTSVSKIFVFGSSLLPYAL